MIDWKCTKCGFQPLLASPAAYDGWIRFEMSRVVNGRVVRAMHYTLDSLECTHAVLNELAFSVRSNMVANEVDGVDEIRDKVDSAVELINEGLETDMKIGDEIVFEGDGYRHVLRKIRDEPSEETPK